MEFLIYFITIFILLITLPFGIWRTKCKKFSRDWFLSIHLPILFIIIPRFIFGIEFTWLSFLLFDGAFVIGQIGGRILGKKYFK